MKKSKVISKGKGLKIPAGPANGMIHGHQHAGKQLPGQTGTSRTGVNKKFEADAGGKGGMFGRQSVDAVKPGQTGKGTPTGGTGGGGGKKKGYGGDANGKPY